MNILHITSSPRGDASFSNRVAAHVSRNSAAAIRTPPSPPATSRAIRCPHFDDDFVAATRSPQGPQTDKQRAMLALSDTLVDELFAADVLVIATPMINFTIPSNLKTWVDYVARAGRTFSYSEAGPKGLVTGKQVILVAARGGVYATNPGARLPGAVPEGRARLPRHDRRRGARESRARPTGRRSPRRRWKPPPPSCAPVAPASSRPPPDNPTQFREKYDAILP